MSTSISEIPPHPGFSLLLRNEMIIIVPEDVECIPGIVRSSLHIWMSLPYLLKVMYTPCAGDPYAWCTQRILLRLLPSRRLSTLVVSLFARKISVSNIRWEHFLQVIKFMPLSMDAPGALLMGSTKALPPGPIVLNRGINSHGLQYYWQLECVRTYLSVLDSQSMDFMVCHGKHGKIWDRSTWAKTMPNMRHVLVCSYIQLIQHSLCHKPQGGSRDCWIGYRRVMHVLARSTLATAHATSSPKKHCAPPSRIQHAPCTSSTWNGSESSWSWSLLTWSWAASHSCYVWGGVTSSIFTA